ncbi:MAG: hypothetical protein AAF564_25440 [Bacteroidota bacterium]
MNKLALAKLRLPDEFLRILDGFMAGKTRTQLAAEMFISDATLCRRIKGITDAFQAKTVEQALMRAVSLGVVGSTVMPIQGDPTLKMHPGEAWDHLAALDDLTRDEFKLFLLLGSLEGAGRSPLGLAEIMSTSESQIKRHLCGMREAFNVEQDWQLVYLATVFSHSSLAEKAARLRGKRAPDEFSLFLRKSLGACPHELSQQYKLLIEATINAGGLPTVLSSCEVGHETTF